MAQLKEEMAGFVIQDARLNESGEPLEIGGECTI
jgi:hypothetical protein